VFPFYDNFAGSNLNGSWTTDLPASHTARNGSYFVNNGLTVGSYPNAPGYVVTAKGYSTGAVFDSYITGIGNFDSVGFFNTANPTYGLTYVGAFIRAFGDYTFPDQWNTVSNAFDLGEANFRFGQAVFDESPPIGYFQHSLGVSGVYSVGLLSDVTSLQYLDYSEGISLQPMYAHPPGYPLSAGFVAGKSAISVQWARIRALPPRGAMPTVVSLASGLSSSMIVVGGTVIAASVYIGATGDAGGTITYEYFSGSACSGSPTVVGTPVDLAGGTVTSSSPQAFNAVGSYSWNAVYSGDRNNVGVTSGCMRLDVYGSPLLVFTDSCNRVSLIVGSAAICKATVQGSSSTPTGSVSWSSDIPGKFSKLNCKLSKGACSVRFTSASASPSATLTAAYQRMPSEPAYTATFTLAVSMKASRTIVSCSPTSVVAASLKTVTCRARVTGYSPTGTVSWYQSGTGSVSLSSTTCTLAKGACSVTMTGATAGMVTLQGTYSGDPNNQVSSRTATLTIM
jgi:hypothetical protein